MYYTPYRLLAELIAAVGVLMGILWIVDALGMFQFRFWVGLTATSIGIYIIIGSMMGLFAVYAVLTLVKAGVDTRNAAVT